MKQYLMWTALPNGFDGAGGLRISAIVSPRLDPGVEQRLWEFHDFRDWPDTLRRSIFTISYGTRHVDVPGNVTEGPARIDRSLGLPDTLVWQALFNEDTFVRKHEFEDMTPKVILSYDVMAMNGLIRQLYGTLGVATSDELPRASHLLNDPLWGNVIASMKVLDGRTSGRLRDVSVEFEQYKNWWRHRADRTDPPRAAADTNVLNEQFARAQLFHTPSGRPQQEDYSAANLSEDDPRGARNADGTSRTRWRTFRQTGLPAREAFKSLIDFHQIISAMNQYPLLLRRLGLVVDFVVPMAAFSPSNDGSLVVQCRLQTLATPGVERPLVTSPMTRAMLTNEQFAVVSNPHPALGNYRIRGGLLEVSPPPSNAVVIPSSYDLIQVDVDGAGIKLMNFGRTLGALGADRIVAEREYGAPSLRNAGLMFVHRGRDLMLKRVFESNLSKNDNLTDGASVSLYAEDVIRGWRIDVWDSKTRKWRSLCERVSEHMLGDLKIADTSEGIVRLAATTSPDEEVNQDLIYLHEAIFSWTGWSLVAPQPGQAINRDDGVSDAAVDIPPGIRLSSVFVPKERSLPRLRYGRKYWVRARKVDLAGNSLPPSERDIAQENPDRHAVPYLRFEPVQAPSFALARANGIPEIPSDAESMQRAAIRSFNVTPEDNAVATNATVMRLVVPAQSSVKEAELHGMLDSGGTIDASPGIYDVLCTMDKALESYPPSQELSPSSASYAVMDVDGRKVPYLPDPLCKEIAVRIFDHPNMEDTVVITVPLFNAGEQWPKAAPFSILASEDPVGIPHFDAQSRVLRVPLPKAAHVTLRLSSRLTPEALSLMGTWQWIKDHGGASLEVKARNGQHWMLTPWRTLELVHAVQKPLLAPEVDIRRVDRKLGETRALPVFKAKCSTKSTSTMDFLAEWHEPDDDLGEAGPRDRARSDHAFSIKITSDRKLSRVPKGFTEHGNAGPDEITVGDGHNEVVIKYHEFGDTRYRRIEYRLEATTRFREFMPQSVLTRMEGDKVVETNENIKVGGHSGVAWIKNSAPPPAPEILYVVPTFGWTSTKKASTQTRWRHGGGLRIYLNRPWNVSGYGEMLAVVMPKPGFDGDPNSDPAGKPYKKFVTQWGNDPAWISSYVSSSCPKESDFPLRRTSPDSSGDWITWLEGDKAAQKREGQQQPGAFKVTGLTHPGLGLPGDEQAYVSVAPHDVVYDKERRLWYCDIVVDAGSSYFPFIRLALARYQPISVDGAHLSNIVLADFMALTPDRWISVTEGTDKRSRNVSVHGHTYKNSAGNAEVGSSGAGLQVSPTSVVEISVEKLDPARGADFGWKPDGSAIVRRKLSLEPAVRSAEDGGIAQLLANKEFEAASELIVVRPIWPSLWVGTVTLPESPSEQARYRLVVSEHEEYVVDGDNPYGKPNAKGGRLVFVDHVELN